MATANWGEGAWGLGAWGEGSISVSVNVTGVASSSSIGTVNVVGLANVSPTGVTASGAIGIETVAAKANVDVTGVFATGEIGIVKTGVGIAVIGLEAEL